MDSAGGHHLVSALHGFSLLFQLLLFLGLRTDHHEIEDGYHSHDHEHSAPAGSCRGLSLQENGVEYVHYYSYL
jgi:hypothetical protein